MPVAVLCIALCVAATTPFEDPQQRFSLVLPDGWEFAPQPGDVFGASFSRNLEGIPANAAVRIINISGGLNLAQLAERVAEGSRHEPGYKLLANEPINLAGHQGRRHRFVMFIAGDPKWSKMVEQRVTVARGRGYVLHVETVAEAFGTFEADFNKMFKSFLVGGAVARRSLGKPDAVLPRTSDRESLVGRWAGGGHKLHLSPSGVVLLDEDHGRYWVDGGLLILHLGERRIMLKYQLRNGSVRLIGGRFGAGKVLSRLKR